MQIVTITPNIISPLLEAITPKDGESLAQAVVRLRGERTAERLAKTKELDGLIRQSEDDSPIVGAALGQPSRSVRDDHQRADLAAEIASMVSAESALTACEHVAKYRDNVAQVEALIPKYKLAVRGFAHQLQKTAALYAPIEPLAEQLRMQLGTLRNHSIGAGPASALLPVPMDSSELALSNEWSEIVGSGGPNPTKLSRWRSEFRPVLIL